MLEVQIENIIPVTEARDKFNQIIETVDGTEELYVLTKNGKPAAIVVGVHHLEKLTGESHHAVFGSGTPSIDEAPATVPQPQLDQNSEPATNFAPISTPPSTEPTAGQLQDQFTATSFAQPTVAPASTDQIAYDNPAPQAFTPSAPASVPASDPGAVASLDSPFVDPSATPSAGQAIAPDAITPTQAGPSTDAFAIPTDPIDLPSDNQAQGTTASTTSVAIDDQANPAAPTQA